MQKIAGKYEVLEEAGSGATGSVYLVRHADLGIKYALKVLNPYVSANETALQRFKQEASALAALEHPGSVRLHDFGQTEVGLYYMTIDYCNGITLQHAGALLPTVESKLEVILQLLSVLRAAHEVDIIHRDIKPENIMLLQDDHGYISLKLLDFGVAKLLQDADKRLTVQGMPIGTPQYMAPEIIAGNGVCDQRSDIYSAGVVLYELLCGKAPFDDPSIVQTLLMHLSQPVPPFDPALEIPAEVELLVMKALAKAAVDRHQTASEFFQACQEVLAGLKSGNAQPTECSEVHEPCSVHCAPAAYVQPARPQGGEVHILCLDDDEVLLGIMEHVLAREGFHVQTTTTPTMVPNMLFKQPFNLLISDIMMPGMQGTKVCELLRHTVQDLRIILFSNIPERDLEKKGRASGADAWMSKNAKPADWLKIIKGVLGQGQAASSARTL